MAVTDLSQVSKTQPMREGEIDAVGTLNSIIASFPISTTDIADASITGTKVADGAITSAKIADGTIATADVADGAITSAKIADGTIETEDVADGAITEEKLAYNAVGTINLVEGAVGSDALATNAVTRTKIMDRAVGTSKLDSDIQAQLTFLASVPTLEFGTSNSFDVPASSYHDIDVTFTAKTETPIVFCSLQHATGNLSYVVTQVTNTQFSARVYNLTTTDTSSVTLDWLTVSGR